ncbi:PD40 domain-containing protein [bacterium]|nr:PD40 domain-containing protein [bacterium]
MFRHVGIFIISSLLMAGPSWAEQPYPKGDPIALSIAGDFYMAPQWSPEGDRVAATGSNYTGLYLIDFPTGNSTQISEAYSAGYGFAWSHDGSKIASRISSFDNMRRTHTLVSFNVDDASMEILSEPRSMMVGVPLWSSTDSHLYLTYADKLESFSVLNSPSVISEPLIYVNDGNMILRAADGLSETSLFSGQDRISSYALSPDGSLIVYSSSGQNLWIANSNGTNLKNLGAGIAPSWSPDSQWITFMVTHDDGHSILEADLYVINTKGQSRTNITNTPGQLEMHPKWSPDASWIVFDTEGQGQLFVQQVAWR